MKWIVRYIFPGGALDHLSMLVGNLENYGFEVHDIEAWREHYARTTRLWHDRLLANFAAAEREVGLFSQVVGPMSRQRSSESKVRAEETVRELAALSVRLHAALVQIGLREIITGS